MAAQAGDRLEGWPPLPYHGGAYPEAATAHLAITSLPLDPLMPMTSLPPLESEDGPLWTCVKRQLYKSEVDQIYRLVGESLIQQNQLMWDETSTLREMHAEVQERNVELQNNSRRQVEVCGTQHRDLLKRQAQIMLDDLRSQAASSGQLLVDILPELKGPRLVQFLSKYDAVNDSNKRGLIFTTPETPSTRPSSSSGCSTTPDPSLLPAHTMTLGRQLDIDELFGVAEGIRDALEVEHAQLFAAIGEQIELIETEDARRAASVGGARSGEPSTVELQAFVRKLHELIVSPTLRTLALVDAAQAGLNCLATPSEPQVAVGGASIRRLQALIAARRCTTARGPFGAVPGASQTLVPTVPPKPRHKVGKALIAERRRTSAKASVGAVPEAMLEQARATSVEASHLNSPRKVGKLAVSFDPFFDDPFA